MNSAILAGLEQQYETDDADLVTVDDVRAFLQIPDSDTEQNPAIQGLVTRASRLIIGQTLREFAPASDGPLTRQFAWDGGPLNLTPYDLRTATTVTIDADTTTPTVLTTTDFSLRPLNHPDGVYRWIKLPFWVANIPRWNLGLTPPYVQERIVSVTGAWGFQTVPADVQQAALVTIGIWLRRDISAFSRTFNLDEQRTERPDALPSAAAAMLARYQTVPAP